MSPLAEAHQKPVAWGHLVLKGQPPGALSGDGVQHVWKGPADTSAQMESDGQGFDQGPRGEGQGLEGMGAPT